MPSSRHWRFQPESAWVGAHSLPVAGSHWVVVCCTESTCALDPTVKHFHGIWKQWEALSQSLLVLSKHDCSFILLHKPGTYLQPMFLESPFQVKAWPSWGFSSEKGSLEAYPYSLTIPLQQLILLSLPGLPSAKPILRHPPLICTLTTHSSTVSTAKAAGRSGIENWFRWLWRITMKSLFSNPSVSHPKHFRR